jgi:hypothetical protein
VLRHIARAGLTVRQRNNDRKDRRHTSPSPTRNRMKK